MRTLAGRIRRYGVIAAAGLLLSACGGDEEAAVEEDAGGLEVGGGGVVTIFTDRTELFFEYPAMVAGAPGDPWAIHFTDLSSFGPVTQGRLTLEFEGPDGQTHRTVSDAPSRPGHYDPAPTLPEAGMYDLVMTLEGPQVDDEIFVGPVRVYPSAEALPFLPPAEDVGIAFLKEQQWPIEFATVPADVRPVASGIEAPGQLLGAPGSIVEITAPVDGIVRWDLNRSALAEGSRVRAGEPLVRLSPVGGDDTYATLKSDAARLRREVERNERLVEAEAIPRRRLEEARHDLEVVEARLGAIGASDDDAYTLTLRSPIDGYIVARAFVAGERVSATARLLTVVDPRQLLLTFSVPAGDAGAVVGVSGATFTPEGGSEVHRTTSLRSVGAMLDPQRRTLPVMFDVANPSGELKVGMLVQGRILTEEAQPVLAVPTAAVMDEDGLLVAYVQIGGETFERRAITVGASDGQWTEILSGVRRGERIVTAGQYQIKLSSLNTSEISDHGHPH